MRRSLQDLQRCAASHGGKCLSTTFTHIDAKYGWECSKGHHWFAKGSNVLTGKRWCLECSGHKKLSIEYLQAIAKQRGGECLTKTYKNVDSRYEWQCAVGHEWQAEATNVLHNKTWCPKCARTAPHTLKDLQLFAAKLGGKCLSQNYGGILGHYDWECKKSHRWRGSANNVINHGHWCRLCSYSKHSKPELVLYERVKALYPDAIHAPTGLLRNKRFELDIYIPSLQKAIELDGVYWHSSEIVRARDREKGIQCLEVGIRLFRVDESVHRKTPDESWAQILEFLQT